MPQNNKIKIFMDEIYSNPPRKKYNSNKIVCNDIDENGALI